VSRYSKTIVAAVITAVQFIVALSTDPGYLQVVADSNVTQSEAWILLASIIGVGGVFAKANTPPAGQPSDPNISETSH
jgi:hypothetical protein